jgi:transposase
MARPIRPLEISDEQRKQLRSMVMRATEEQRLVRRAKMVLLRAEGKSQEQVAEICGVNRPVVSVWEQRFRSSGVAGLLEGKRSGRRKWLPPEKTARILSEVVTPPPGVTRWSSRRMARHVGVCAHTVQKIWKANDLKPHLSRTFKISNDPRFVARFWDVIGLYLNPPEKALVFCCDEKSQCQALERSQPGLPLGQGHITTHTHDYTRHGTVTLFAALNYLDGTVIQQVESDHKHPRWLAFLKQVERQAPAGLTLHIILDNYATHKHHRVYSWLRWINARNRTKHQQDRIVLHFTPTSASWLNLVERFFRDITVDCIRDGSFQSADELAAQILAYIKQHNAAPKRYVWKAEGAAILERIQRARLALKKQPNGSV